MNTLVLLAILVGIFALVLEIYWPRIKGAIGEDYVSVKLSRLDPAEYVVLEDLLLPSNGTTKTTQIDHVVVSNFGIFVIETKAHKGWIFGSEHQTYWTQVIYRHKNHFYSPLRQNYGHIKSIEALVSPIFPNVQIIGLVVFPYADKLKVSGTNAVVSGEGLLSRLQEYHRPLITYSERDLIALRLKQANILDKTARREHIAAARKRATTDPL